MLLGVCMGRMGAGISDRFGHDIEHSGLRNWIPYSLDITFMH
jgi:hypothetical protein